MLDGAEPSRSASMSGPVLTPLSRTRTEFPSSETLRVRALNERMDTRVSRTDTCLLQIKGCFSNVSSSQGWTHFESTFVDRGKYYGSAS